MNVLGIDIGYGYTKSYFSQVDSINRDTPGFHRFPTAVTKFIPKSTFTESQVVFKVNGEEFIVGDNALHEGMGLINTKRSDFVGSNAYCAALAFALSRIPYKKDAILVLGLPPGQFNKEYVSSLTNFLRTIKISTSDNHDINLPAEIRFIPQGSGIFFSYIKNNNAHDLYKKVAIIDVGYYTFDTLFFTNGRYVENSAKSHQIGVSKIYEQVKKEFNSKHRIFLKNDESIEKLLLNNTVKIIGKDFDLDTTQMIKSYNAEITSLIGNYIEELPGEADILIAGGGGVKFLSNAFFKFKINTVDKPQYANARGYFEYGRHALKSRR